MRAIFLLLVLAGFSTQILAVEAGIRLPDAMIILDTSVNNIPTVYDASAGSQVKSVQEGVTRVQILNMTTELIAASVAGPGCVGAIDHYIIPQGPNNGNSIWQVAAGRRICLRSESGSPISSGKVYISGW